MYSFEESRLRILILEDSDFDAELIYQELTHGGMDFQGHRVQTRDEFERGLAEFLPDLVFVDFRLPTFDGAAALEIAVRNSPDLPVIIISGIVGEETAVELLKQGATDFVLKDRLSRLVPAVRRALREISERKARREAESSLRELNEQLELKVAARTSELRHKNALMEEDLQMARELQMALLPSEFPTLPRGAALDESAVRFCSVYHPTHLVGGDYFNVVDVSDSAIGVFICDVMGHGVRAALVTAMMRALGEQLSSIANQPGRLLTEINHAMCGILSHSGTDLFATACYVIADVEQGRMFYANAGHPSPLLVHSGSRQVEPINPNGSKGPALGFLDDVCYRTQERALEAEDLVLFFTDGLFEVENPKEEAFSELRLHEVVRRGAGLTSAKLVHSVVDEVERFRQGCEFGDDVCLVAMEIARLATAAR